jgi:NAD(P)-dependent dehydrogenase (short-subunit alcohol dehydrogenase family)
MIDQRRSDVTGELAGKVAIVTGAARGIGLETARVLAGAGAKVVLADLPGSDLERAAGSVEGEVAHRAVDIADEESVRGLVDFTVETFGRLDVVDNNAARGGDPGDALVGDMSVEIWDGVFAVNARGTMLMCKHSVRAMVETGGGSIVNISSGTAQGGDDHASAYACTKAAIQTLTRYVATQYGHQGIRCNAIAPGLVRTPLLESVFPEQLAQIYVAHKLVGRMGEPRDIAELVCFLASDRSSYITGQIIAADGGFFAHLPPVPEVRRWVADMQAQAGAG